MHDYCIFQLHLHVPKNEKYVFCTFVVYFNVIVTYCIMKKKMVLIGFSVLVVFLNVENHFQTYRYTLTTAPVWDECCILKRTIPAITLILHYYTKLHKTSYCMILILNSIKIVIDYYFI